MPQLEKAQSCLSEGAPCPSVRLQEANIPFRSDDRHMVRVRANSARVVMVVVR